MAAWCRREKRRFRSWFDVSLFRVILGWTLLAIGLFTVLVWLWGGGFAWSRGWWSGDGAAGRERVAPIEVVKVALTTIGGIGAVGYLVIKYRERASAEREEVASDRRDAEARLLTAVEQLGSDSPQVRIAGVYALADVADTYKEAYKQRVVDILCGYLRTERGQWVPATGHEDESAIVVRGRTCVSTDGPVESTVLDVLARHLRKARTKLDYHKEVVQEVNDDQLWCDCSIDLHNAIFVEPVLFQGTFIVGDANFGRATFTGKAGFEEANFTGNIIFENATFSRSADFFAASFLGDVDFSAAIFIDISDFRNARFIGSSTFDWASFHSYSRFTKALFHSEPSFLSVEFREEVVFNDASFESYSGFKNSKFARFADFCGVTFHEYADFLSAHFEEDASFVSTIFGGIANFDGAAFKRRPNFDRAVFYEAWLTSLLGSRSGNGTGLPPGARWGRSYADGRITANSDPDGADNIPSA